MNSTFTSNRMKLLCRLVSVMILGASVSQWKIFMPVTSLGQGTTEITSALLALLLIVLLIASVVGIFLCKTWGFYYFYMFNFMATAFFSMSLVPFIADFFPSGWRTNGVVIINGLLLLITVNLHREAAREDTSDREGQQTG